MRNSSIGEGAEAAVVVCSDATWAWQGAYVLSRSMALDRSCRLDHHAYLVGDVPDDLIEVFPEGVQVHHLPEYPRAIHYSPTTHVPLAAVLRLFALEELAKIYHRVIYLDGDVFQAWGSLADLLDLPETGRPLAAVRSRSHWPDRERLRHQKSYVAALNPKIGSNYFNSGVLLVNGPVWTSGGYSTAALDFFQQNQGLCRYVDQSALNAVIEGDWDSLSPGWNWQMSKTSYPLVSGRRPRLVHFTGPIKPWNDRLRLFDPAIFADMKQFLRKRGAEHLLDPGVGPDGFTLEMERRRMRELAVLVEDPLGKRDSIKRFLDAEEHIDHAAGIAAYGVGAAGSV
ncbi:glycosyltransferase family 8 protein [Tabrizicola caldifontis]|uniref:glycosyltransferase family 8 protein n=1 Tax=Tabrizicola caldifontis TaxID=2528036 RepID=UPI001F10AB77|nr:glycosyltransferase [Rhodobacter sp. YIM 73028]